MGYVLPPRPKRPKCIENDIDTKHWKKKDKKKVKEYKKELEYRLLFLRRC